MDSPPRDRAGQVFKPVLITRNDLISHGFTVQRIRRSLRSGALVRLRRDRYMRQGAPDAVAAAGSIGARVTCLTLLQMLGIFVLSAKEWHFEVTRNSSRFALPPKEKVHLHWAASSEQRFLHVTGLHAAIRHAVRCQQPRAALATLDSLLHHGLVTREQLAALFAELPRRFQALLMLADGSAASGPETFVRLMLRALGVSYETQVHLAGVGYVDFVVEGWLIIECDSKEFHEGWEKQMEDRRRDLAAARLGYVTVRPLATDILHDFTAVQRELAAIIAALGTRYAPRPRR
ncbi:endonuclease domain-containing protein [Microbacterium sp. LWO12-1.2]|uniref:endonuclease domain-containing protein n=1 Tax=Microbacterium sp. LWO12-1.2 TaxID=3135261 RepID=UPI00342E7C6C